MLKPMNIAIQIPDMTSLLTAAALSLPGVVFSTTSTSSFATHCLYPSCLKSLWQTTTARIICRCNHPPGRSSFCFNEHRLSSVSSNETGCYQPSCWAGGDVGGLEKQRFRLYWFGLGDTRLWTTARDARRGKGRR
ncbi:hypothetical protein FB446DRAFT_361925 [Lentinula raphanica]|nr:hypothetical protein FB446DRAFT_361925 [Lentinula raphanica]